jgi:hypothetical protein
MTYASVLGIVVSAVLGSCVIVTVLGIIGCAVCEACKTKTRMIVPEVDDYVDVV